MQKFVQTFRFFAEESVTAAVLGWLAKFVLVTITGPILTVASLIGLSMLEPILGDGDGWQSFNMTGALVMMGFSVFVSWYIWLYSWNERSNENHITWTRYLAAALVIISPLGWYKLLRK